MDYIAIIDTFFSGKQTESNPKSTAVGVIYAEGITIFLIKVCILTNCLIIG